MGDMEALVGDNFPIYSCAVCGGSGDRAFGFLLGFFSFIEVRLSIYNLRSRSIYSTDSIGF